MPVIVTEEYVRFLIAKVESLEALVESLKALVENLTAQNEELTGTVSSLNATIEQLNATIKELQEKINKNSHNSSKPPSSDGYGKTPAPKSLRKKSGMIAHAGFFLYSALLTGSQIST